MKFIVIFALICVAISFVESSHTTDYGNVKSTAINIENVFVERAMFKVQNKTVTLPWTTWPFKITGIRHIDHKIHPVNVTITKGGIGHKTVTVNILSKRGFGINSTFLFYGKFY